LLKGERLLKDVYEALRASPKWNKTVLFVAYDDAGGYYDHVVPPFEGAFII
jgi:phospholipase C